MHSCRLYRIELIQFVRFFFLRLGKAAILGKNHHYGSAALRQLVRQKDYDVLHYCARQTDINAIENLIAEGSRTPSRLEMKRLSPPLSPMGESIIGRDQAAVKILLQEGCNPNALAACDGFDGQNSKQLTMLQRISLLLMAIEIGDLHTIQLLVESGADIDHRPRLGLIRSPLQRAAEVGNFEAAEHLLSCGAPVDSESFYFGGTPLQLAAIMGHINIIALLLDNGADPNFAPARGDGRTAFEGAAEWGCVGILSLLIKRGVQLDLVVDRDLDPQSLDEIVNIDSQERIPETFSNGTQHARSISFARKRGQVAIVRFIRGLLEQLLKQVD